MEPMAQQPLVLIGEADSLVGLDLSDALESAGYRVLGPFATTGEALAALDQDSPTLAVIDIALKDGSCTRLADELRLRRVPFLVHSVHRYDKSHPVSFQGAPWLVKPASPWELVALLNAITSSSPALMNDETAMLTQRTQQPEASANPFVRKLKGFAALSDADQAMLERISANPRTVAPGTDLVCEGDKPDGVFLVMDGMAYRHKVRANGQRQIMAYLVPGDACDLDVALLDEMDHTITTFSACKVVRIPPETVADLLKNHPQIARALRMTTLVDEATLREWLVNVGCRSAGERLAHLFCELLIRLRAVGLAPNDSYALPITQSDLGDTTGLSNVHVNRTLQELRRQGLIELKSGHLTILDPPQLKSLAEFKSNYLHLGGRIAA